MKKTTRTMVIFVIVLSLCLMMQDCLAAQWSKTYGGSDWDEGYAIQQTRDGGYIVAGHTESYGVNNDDLWVLKLDLQGSVTWQKTYGGVTSDIAYSIQQTTDDGYIVAGSTTSFGAGAQDMWILKLDSMGNISWQKAYGGGSTDSAWSIKQTGDGGYIVAGTTFSFGTGNYDIWIVKLRQNGTAFWQKTYGSGGNDIAYSIQQTTDDGYIVAGTTTSFGAGSHDIWVIKLDEAGNISWEKTYGGSGSEDVRSIQQTTDGGYIVAGRTLSFGAGSYDVWVLKLYQNGEITWQKTYGGSSGERANSIQQTTDGGYIVGGTTASFGAGYDDSCIMKLDSSGNLSWQKSFGESESEKSFSIQQTTDGGYIVAGLTQSVGAGDADMHILKLDSNGYINNCNSMAMNDPVVTASSITDVDSTASMSIPSPVITNTVVVPQSSLAQVEVHCFVPDWFPVEPPTQNKLNGVWGYISYTGSHEFYAVGEAGAIIHFDGSSWTGTGSPTSYDLYGIWGSSEAEIFTVGEHGTIFHYGDHNGEYSWAAMDSGSTTNLNDVWGSSATDVYAVGAGGFIARFNGTDWLEETHGLTTETLTGIWGSASDNYVAVGEGGKILSYNGYTWASVESGTTVDLKDVWGSASDNIYAVGKSGTIIHYKGSTWAEIASPTSANLRGIWGSTANNIFAVGEHGTILYYDGTIWTKLDSGVQDSLISTFGTLNPRVMVVGYDGNILSLGGPSVQGKICNACTGEGIDEVSVEFDRNGVESQTVETDEYGIYPSISSQGGPYPILFTATDYLTKEITIDLPFNSAIVDHATYLLPDPGYEGCLSGTITRTVLIGTIPKENKRGVQNIEVKLYQGSNEIDSTVTDIGGNYHFTGLAPGTYGVEPVIISSECTTTPGEHTNISVPITLPCDQNSIPPWCSFDFELNCPESSPSSDSYWQEMVSGTSNLLHGIWGSGSNNIFAVGDNGVIINYDGGNWNSQESRTSGNLMGVWGSSENDVYAVGKEGMVLKTVDGGTHWYSMSKVTPFALNAIWGSSANDIFAVGDHGTIIRGNGTIWTLMSSGTEVKLLGVWGTSANDVYAVGNSHKDGYWKRTVIHYNGTAWAEVDTGNGVTLMSPWGSSSTDITAAGSFGSIMRYDGVDWKQIGGPTEKTLNAMWGSSGSNIFAVGYNGVIAHYDGTEWSVRETEQGTDLYGIWGETSPDIYAVAVGDNGKIFAYTGDLDGDTVLDVTDNCPDIGNPGQDNSDTDGHGDACDNCPNDDNEDQANSDYDELGNACDNCPYNTNEGQANGDGDSLGDICDNCPTATNENQADTFPPQGNGCGDACECEGNFDGDEDVDGGDAASFKSDFGRSGFKNPCSNDPVCKGNFDCDNDVDGADAALFKEDFGRSGFKNPCPSCPAEQWCIY